MSRREMTAVSAGGSSGGGEQQSVRGLGRWNQQDQLLHSTALGEREDAGRAQGLWPKYRKNKETIKQTGMGKAVGGAFGVEGDVRV